MPQDQDSGSRANRFGKENAARIANAINATLLDPQKSNLASHAGRRVVLKSARAGNNFIGIPYSLLKQVSAVIAAFEEEQRGKFVVLDLPADIFRKEEKPQPGREVGQVPRSVFYARGREIANFVLDKG